MKPFIIFPVEGQREETLDLQSQSSSSMSLQVD